MNFENCLPDYRPSGSNILEKSFPVLVRAQIFGRITCPVPSVSARPSTGFSFLCPPNTAHSKTPWVTDCDPYGMGSYDSLSQNNFWTALDKPSTKEVNADWVEFNSNVIIDDSNSKTTIFICLFIYWMLWTRIICIRSAVFVNRKLGGYRRAHWVMNWSDLNQTWSIYGFRKSKLVQLENFQSDLKF